MGQYSFQEVMKQYDRMIKAHKKGVSIPVEASYETAVKQPDFFEECVMEWAAEHPEPVYPSVAEYLEQFGITIRRDGSLEADFFKANEPMSADMAKLLGIGSGEGENEKTD